MSLKEKGEHIGLRGRGGNETRIGESREMREGAFSAIRYSNLNQIDDSGRNYSKILLVLKISFGSDVTPQQLPKPLTQISKYL